MIKRRGYFIIIIFLIITQITINYLFVVKKTPPCSWDYDEVHQYYHDTKVYYNAIKQGAFFKDFHSLPISRIRPPLLMILALPFISINQSARYILLTNSIAIIILLFSVYYLGRIIKSRKVGLISALIISGFPLGIVLSRVFMPAYLLSSIFTLSLLFLILSGGFKNRGYSVLFGIMLGLGMLCKWTFFIFMLGPILYFIFKNSKQNRPTYYWGSNFFLSLITGGVICAFWYMLFWKEIFKFLYSVSIGTESFLFGPTNIFGLKSLFAQIFILNHQISFPFYVCFLVSIFFIFKSKNRYKYFLFITLITPYLFFAFVRNKHIRLTAPMLPLISIFIALFLENINGKFLRRVLTIGVLGFTCLNFYMFTFPGLYLENIWSLTPNKVKKFGLLSFNITDINSKRPFISSISLVNFKLFTFEIVRSWRAKIKKEWKVEEIVDKIEKSSNPFREIKIFVIPDLEPIWTGIFDLIQVRKIPAIVKIIPREEALFSKINYKELFNGDYVVIKKTWLAPGYYGPNPTPALELIQKHEDEFKLLGKFEVLDGDTVLLYKKLVE